MSRRLYADGSDIPTLALSPGKNYVETPAIKALTQRALSYLQAGIPLHLRGPAGSGKTTLAFRLAAELGRQTMFLAGDESVVTADLIGKQARFHHRKVVDRYIHSVIKYEESIDQEWTDSRLTVACREGCTLIYDEFTRSRPEANNVLLGILEERLLALPSGGGGEYVPVHPDFRIIFTSNPREYAGVHDSQDALNDRVLTIDIDYFEEYTEVCIAAARSGLAPEFVTPVVRLVRAYRDSGCYQQIPTPRASIMIAKMAAIKKLEPVADNPDFVQLCLDMLEGKGAHWGDGEASAGNRQVLRRLIEQCCGGKSTSSPQPGRRARVGTVDARAGLVANGTGGAYKQRRVHQ